MENGSEPCFDINEYEILDHSGNIINKKEKKVQKKENQFIDEDLVIFSYIESYNEDTIFGPILNKLQDQKKTLSERIKRKINDIIICLIGKKQIDYKTLRKLVFEGIPDEFPGVRSIVWKLMLNFLPNSVAEWKDYIEDRRLDYENIKMDYIGINIGAGSNISDYALNNADKFLLNEIIKDVKRTRSHMHFFTSKYNENETNADLITRILYIFGKLHPDIAYVQGMNEIIAPIFYCFSKDPNPFFNLHIEADVFYCFENMMLEIKEIFLREKDETESGIHQRINKISNLLEWYDEELHNHFQAEKMELHFFMFRWYTLFFTQEFNMPDTLRLWDSLIIQNDKFDFVSYLCLAMIIINRNVIINKDFSNIMYTLQNLPLLDINIENFIKKAIEIKSTLSPLLAEN